MAQQRSARTARRTVAMLATVLAALGGGLAVARAADEDGRAAGAAARPNIVLVMTDDQTVEQMAALARVRALVGEPGTTFARNFASYPLCCPSRATYLTGQYAHNHRVEGNQPPAGGYARLAANGNDNTLPVWLGRAGYATAHIGKYLNGYRGRDRAGIPPGWQEWYGSVDPTTYNFRHLCLNENGTAVVYGGNAATRNACPGAQSRPITYSTDLFTDKAVDYIGRRAPSAQPFFLSVAYLAPHSGGPNGPAEQRCRNSAKPAPRHRGAFANAPLPRPPSFDEPDVRDKPAHIRGLSRLTPAAEAAITTDYRCRRESLLAVDEGVARIVEALRAAGELEDTLIVFTADNGFFQGEHRVPRGKVKAYEPSVRVPLLVRGPGVPAARRVSALTANVDLAATLVDAADARAGRRLDGVSLLRVARDPRAFADRAVLLENGPQDATGNPRYDAVRTARHKYVEYVTGERELYDLKADPHELRNRAGQPRYARVQAQLARLLRGLRGCAGATCR